MHKSAAIQKIVKKKKKAEQIISDQILKGLLKRADGYSMTKDVLANAVAVPFLSAVRAG